MFSSVRMSGESRTTTKEMALKSMTPTLRKKCPESIVVCMRVSRQIRWRQVRAETVQTRVTTQRQRLCARPPFHQNATRGSCMFSSSAGGGGQFRVDSRRVACNLPAPRRPRLCSFIHLVDGSLGCPEKSGHQKRGRPIIQSNRRRPKTATSTRGGCRNSARACKSRADGTVRTVSAKVAKVQVPSVVCDRRPTSTQQSQRRKQSGQGEEEVSSCCWRSVVVVDHDSTNHSLVLQEEARLISRQLELNLGNNVTHNDISRGYSCCTT